MISLNKISIPNWISAITKKDEASNILVMKKFMENKFTN